MRICVDISPAVHHHAGLGRYAQELTAALVRLDPADEYVTFYNAAGVARVDPPLDTLPHLGTRLSAKPWRMGALLAQTAGVSQDRLFPGIDLFHATDHLLPRLTRVRSVFTLHDVIFRLYPETHTVWNRTFLSLVMPRFLRAADRIVTVSECTKRDAIRFYGVPEEKVQVIYNGVAGHFRPAPAEAIAAARVRYGLPAQYLLSVGTIEPRKNLDALLKGYQALRAEGRDLRLVLVGKKGWLYEGFFETLHALGLENEVIFPGFVADEDLPALYSGAELLVFPSLYEGFGLPVAEAMACGTPVACSDSSSLPEVAGDAGLLFDPHDVGALTAAVRRLLDEPALRAELRARGLKQATRFTWDGAARQMLEVYRSVCSGGRDARRH